MTKESQDTNTSQETVQQPAPAPDLSVQDLNTLKQVIDVASQRGAFRPNEMVTVGTIYSKLETFLNAVAESQKPQGEVKDGA